MSSLEREKPQALLALVSYWSDPENDILGRTKHQAEIDFVDGLQQLEQIANETLKLLSETVAADMSSNVDRMWLEDEMKLIAGQCEALRLDMLAGDVSEKLLERVTKGATK